jgi:hypothetical protein
MASGGRTMDSVRWGELSSGLRRRKTRGHGRSAVESRGTASLRERAEGARHGSRRARREALAGRRRRWARWKRPRRMNPSTVQGASAAAMASIGSSEGKSCGASREREERQRACDAREQGVSSAETREQDEGRWRHGDGDRA